MFNLPILRLLQDCEDPPLTPESLEQVQGEAGVRFPDDYAAFLLQFNGGHFHQRVVFESPNPSELGTWATLDQFNGESFNELHLGLIRCSREFRDRLTDDCFAIAWCVGVDLIVLKFKDPDRTEFDGIWYWEYDAIFDDREPLYWLADSFTEFLSMLVLDVCDEDERETLPLFRAIEAGNVTAIERYLTGGGDPEVRNASGETLLAAAVRHSWPPIARVLLEHAADANAPDDRGLTPLHHAVNRSLDCVKLLLAAGADMSVRSKKGYAAIDRCTVPRAFDLLRQHGAENDVCLREELRRKDPDYLQLHGVHGRVSFCVSVQARARKSEILGISDGNLQVAITESTIKGKANQAIIEMLAAALNVPASQISLSGGKARTKKFFDVVGFGFVELRDRLWEGLAGGG